VTEKQGSAKEGKKRVDIDFAVVLGVSFGILLVIVVAYANPVEFIGHYYYYLFLAYLVLALALKWELRAPGIAGIALMMVSSLLMAKDAEAANQPIIYAFCFLGISLILGIKEYIVDRRQKSKKEC